MKIAIIEPEAPTTKEFNKFKLGNKVCAKISIKPPMIPPAIYNMIIDFDPR
jgi:hypothetical protein